MAWRFIALVVFLFSEVKPNKLNFSQVDPVLREQYLELGNDTMENQNFYQFTTENIFQPKYFPHDDPKLLAILRKHLEPSNPGGRKKSIKTVLEAFERDKIKLKEIEKKEHIKGLRTKLWPTLIPTPWANTPKWFLKKSSDANGIFCHLCLVNFPEKAKFDRHYVRHFVDPKKEKLIKGTRKRIKTTPTSNHAGTTEVSQTTQNSANTTQKFANATVRRKIKVLRRRTVPTAVDRN